MRFSASRSTSMISSPTSSSRSQQLVAQRHHEVPVLVEQRVHVGLGLVEQPLDRGARVFVGEHLADDALRDRPASTASNDTSEPAMPNEPTICAAMRRGVHEVAARAGARLTEEQLLGRHAAERDLHQPSSSERVRVKRSSLSECASRPSASRRLMIDSTSSLRF